VLTESGLPRLSLIARGLTRQIETVYSNKVSKVMQETEGVLRQVHIDLDEADRARQDLLLFQLKKKKLTWVPDQLVAACQGQGCGRVRRAARRIWCASGPRQMLTRPGQLPPADDGAAPTGV